MAKVRRLPDDLANQIAAGEVVERPASAVKELVENALDAGATRVTVEIDQGGVARLVVSDDGEGMTEEDARLALERHATSKIARIEDLARLGSFGFRGEALPSIASVSRLVLTTRARGQNEGAELTVVAGGPVSARPAGASVGTTVEVHELFSNVPARRKFLKATATESAHVTEVVTVAALARPEVTFVLRRDGKVVREWLRAGSRGDRARAVFRDETLVTIEAARGTLSLEAFLAAPERARAGMGSLYIFVNGRPVRDRQLGRAVAQAYGSVLEGGRYPIGVVHVSLPQDGVDVNVHPQKAEVRFAEGRAVMDAVTRALHTELAKAFRVPPLGMRGQSWRGPGPVSSIAGAGSFPFGSSGHGTSDAAYAASVARGQAAAADVAAAQQAGAAGATDALADPWGLAEGAAPIVGLGALGAIAAAVAEPLALPLDGPLGGTDAPFRTRALQFLAQVRLTFLVCQGEDGLYILDQHAAAERVTFDRLRRQHRARTVATQQLLVPELVEVTAAEVALVEERAEEALGLGLELRSFGPTTVAVHAVPKLLVRARPARLVRDLLSELSREAARPFGGAVDLALATMACHGSVRAGDKLTAEEATALLRDLDEVDFAGHCPHGRPIVLRLGWSELERRVGR